jgi:hypothetical protein
VPRILLIAVLLQLTGCGGGSYYTHDVFFEQRDTEGWRKNSTWWEGPRGSNYSCGDVKATYVSQALTSKATAHAFLGIPIVPTDKGPVRVGPQKEDPATKLQIALRYTNARTDGCAIEDVRVTVDSAGKPARIIDANLFGKPIKGSLECRYVVDVQQAGVDAFSLQVSPGKLGCEAPVLRLKRNSGYLLHSFTG